MMMNLVKAASGFLRCGAARLLLAAAMSVAAWAQLQWVWARMGVAPMSPSVLLPTMALGLWQAVLFVVAVGMMIDESCESGSALAAVSRKLPFVVWAGFTRGGRVEVWMALLWILLWPAEVLACLATALWALGAGAVAAMRLTLWRRP